jgi:tetratricopeptide (TPR) repeat protein
VRRILCPLAVALVVCAAGIGAWPGPAAARQSAPAVTAEVLLGRALAERRASPTRALPLAEQAAAAARAAGQHDAEIRALILVGDCQNALAQLPASTTTYRSALDLSRAKGTARQTAEVRFRLSKNLVSLNRYEEAIQGYLEAVKLAESAGDTEFAAVVTDHLGIAHFVLRNKEKALELCQRASVVLEKARDQALYAENLQHIGIIHTSDGHWAEALTSFNRALAIRERVGDKSALIGTLGNVALALHRVKRDNEALVSLARALSLAAGAEDPRIEPFLRLRRANVLASLGRVAEAEQDFEDALRLDRTLGNKRRLASTLEATAEFYRTQPGHEARAMAYLTEALSLNRAVYSEETSSRINELQARFDAERRDRQIQLLQRDKALRDLETARERQIRLAAAIVTLLLVGGLVFAVVRYRAEARTARELREAMLRVRTLQGLLPICAHCKKIRDDDGYWQQVEAYVGEHSDAKFSHSICPECMRGHYADVMAEDVTATESGA